MSLLDKIKTTALGIFGLYMAVLWFFGGFIGAVIAAFNESLINVVLSLFIPFYGMLYTIIKTIDGIF